VWSEDTVVTGTYQQQQQEQQQEQQTTQQQPHMPHLHAPGILGIAPPNAHSLQPPRQAVQQMMHKLTAGGSRRDSAAVALASLKNNLRGVFDSQPATTSTALPTATPIPIPIPTHISNPGQTQPQPPQHQLQHQLQQQQAPGLEDSVSAASGWTTEPLVVTAPAPAPATAPASTWGRAGTGGGSGLIPPAPLGPHPHPHAHPHGPLHGSHRKLSVALNPQRQYGSKSELDSHLSSSVVSTSLSAGDSLASIGSGTGSRDLFGGYASVSNNNNNNSSIVVSPRLSHPSSNNGGAATNNRKQSTLKHYDNDSNSNNTQPMQENRNVSNESSHHKSSQLEDGANAPHTDGRNHHHHHHYPKEPVKIVVDSAVVLPKTRVIIGKYSLYYYGTFLPDCFLFPHFFVFVSMSPCLLIL
jgi:hypothetical protein